MSRHVRFCGLCGRAIRRPNPTFDDRFAYCAEHQRLRVDAEPADPVEAVLVDAGEFAGYDLADDREWDA